MRLKLIRCLSALLDEMKMRSLTFWWPFNFCKTRVQTKTSRVIPQAPGKGSVQELRYSRWGPSGHHQQNLMSVLTASSNRTWSILQTTYCSSAGVEHLGGGGGERLPAWDSGWRYHLWRVKSSPIPSLAGQRAAVPVLPSELQLLAGWRESSARLGLVLSELRKGSLVLSVLLHRLLIIPDFTEF